MAKNKKAVIFEIADYKHNKAIQMYKDGEFIDRAYYINETTRRKAINDIISYIVQCSWGQLIKINYIP